MTGLKCQETSIKQQNLRIKDEVPSNNDERLGLGRRNSNNDYLKLTNTLLKASKDFVKDKTDLINIKEQIAQQTTKTECLLTKGNEVVKKPCVTAKILSK